MDRDVAEWIVAQVAQGRRLVRARRLTGGLTSEVTGVAVEDRAGRTHRMVLRRWRGEPWPDGKVDDGRVLAPREAEVLSLLESTALPAPRMVAVDPSGAHAGLPALLMTRLPGRLDLTPVDPDEWTRRLAEQLVRVHVVDAPPLEWAYEHWLRVGDAPAAAGADRDARWRAALEILATAPVDTAPAFVHRDYQQFNVLWSRHGVVSGVVDWVWAGAGPADGDVVHCRTNLCLLYGAGRAIDFQRAYEELAGRRISPWWDVAGAVDGFGWTAADLQKQAGRRLRVDGGTFAERVDALLGWVLRRLG
jgi:aminoglycoside phosphotransferase (APT) family kinase protein